MKTRKSTVRVLTIVKFCFSAFSNKDLLLQNGYITHENITMDEYEQVVNTLNASALNFTLETCSLSEQLDNVIGKHLSCVYALIKKVLISLLLIFKNLSIIRPPKGQGWLS